MQIYIEPFKKKKRRVRKIFIHNRVVITETLNNMFLVITKLQGNVICKASIGQVCTRLRLQLRKTPLSAELLGKYIGARMLERNLTQYTLIISKAFTRNVKNAIKGLMTYATKCKRIRFLAKVSHNGVRLRNKKRK